MIQLTQEQRCIVEGGNPVRVLDKDLGKELVICPVDLFESMQARLQEMAEDEQEQDAWLKMSTRNLARRLTEEEHD